MRSKIDPVDLGGDPSPDAVAPRGAGGASAPEALSFIEAARRAQIIACAIRTIAAHGLAQTTLARIAAEAGISKGVISYHFAGKDALIAQVQAAINDQAAAFIRPRVEAAQGARARLLALIDASVRYMAHDRDAIISLVEIATHALQATGHLNIDPAPLNNRVALLDRMLARGQDEGVFRAFSVPVMRNAIIATVDGIAPLLRCDPQTDLDTIARELVQVFDLATRKESLQ
ncbi:TetR/AcrR family transcriptional regulator [Zavarzinia sp. CC-PAN008]|uniref:TetR/AcrR family transcriptional regulator n=1 Tax=Zavarzinia sp. CC-PAN008 TaxID=3243332 RepID=UPI003F742120